MWQSQKTSRRKEIRKGKAERGHTIRQRLQLAARLGPLGLALGTGLIAALILNAGGDVLHLRVGESVPRALAARVQFEIPDENQTDALRAREYANAPNYYVFEPTVIDDIRGRFVNALTLAKAHSAEPERLREEAAQRSVILDDPAAAELIRLASQPESTEFQQMIDRAMNQLALQPLVESNEKAHESLAFEAILLDAPLNRERRIRVLQLLESSDPDAAANVARAVAAEFSPPLRNAAQVSIARMLRPSADGAVKPLFLYRYDGRRSIAAAEAARSAVQKQFQTFPAGAILADKGPISRDERELVAAEHNAFVAQRSDAPEAHVQHLSAIFGRAILALLVCSGLIAYLAAGRRSALHFTPQQIVTTATLLLLLALARFTYVQTGIAFLAVGSMALGAAILSLGFARGPLFAVCGALAVLITLAVNESIGFFLILLAVSATLMFGLRDVRTRGKVVLVGAIAGAVAFLATLANGWLTGQHVAFILQHQALWAAGMAILAGFIVEGVLPGIERAFGLSTSMTLLEWCDPSKPLLRMLAAEAAGTYNHSLLVGALAESAAEAIGANGLLARTGAYYHDIGKINKPEYFVENQAAGVSRHERLAPQMSLLIIIGHVKDGIEMAKEYNVPAAIRPFIAQHHGTTVVEFFYHAANKQRKPGEPEVAETEYRYPGPKPQSREIAVVMICDAVEGAVRSMAEPTPARIEDTVERVVHRRLMDGQFDECELTLRDLQTIERSVVKSLNGIYHARINYPDEEKEAVEARSAS